MEHSTWSFGMIYRQLTEADLRWVFCIKILVVILGQLLRAVVPDAVAEPDQHVVVLQIYARRLAQFADKRRDVLLCPVRAKTLEDHHNLARVIVFVDNIIRT